MRFLINHLHIETDLHLNPNIRHSMHHSWFFLATECYAHQNFSFYCTENKSSSNWQLCHHLWHHKLSLRQRTVPRVTTKLSIWRYFVFSVVSQVYPLKRYSTSHRLCTRFYCALLRSYHQFLVDSCDPFTHILQGCFTDTGALLWLPQYQWSHSDGYM